MRSSSGEQETTSREQLSAVILAGGQNSRMGSEKAFLLHQGRAFVSTIAAQMSRVSDDVVVMTGEKDARRFIPFLEADVRVFKDDRYLSNPLGGIMSGLGHVKHARTALLACDAPLLKAEVIGMLSDLLGDHPAAVPVREIDDASTMEPLCAVYRVAEAKEAAAQALQDARKTAKRMVTLMGDVLYVDASHLRQVDPSLDSLVDINTREEYQLLVSRAENPTLTPEAGARRRGRG